MFEPTVIQRQPVNATLEQTQVEFIHLTKVLLTLKLQELLFNTASITLKIS